MKTIRNGIFLLLLALCCLCLLRGSGLLPCSGRLWVGGTELSAGGSYVSGGGFPCGGGTAVYDPDAGTLTLTDAVISGGFHGAAIYAEGNLTVRLVGDSVLSGGEAGIVALGDLTVYGGGSLTVTGLRSGAAVRGCLSVFDRAAVTLTGHRPLRWGRLHVSPMATLQRDEGRFAIRAPYEVTLLDGQWDAAAHPLSGPGLFDRFEVRRGEAVPQPGEPVREGYWFGGWYGDPALTQPFDFAAPREDSVLLYARWIQIVRLSFDSWGGSETSFVETGWGDPALPPADPVRPGYQFSGWYGDEGLSQPVDWSLGQTESRCLYARWTKEAVAAVPGIDAARYQGQVDWPAVKAAGAGFVFLRAGYRGYGAEGSLNTDDNFEVNYTAATEAGLDVGVYFFSQATSPEEARTEAEYVLALLDGRALSLPVVMDYELASDASGALVGRLYEAGLSGEEHAQNCLAFCAAVEEQGYTAAVYAGNRMLEDTVGQALQDAGYPVWLAHWTVQTRYNGDYEYWQYTGSGQIDGIEGAVDLDWRYIQTPDKVTGLTLLAGEGFNFLYWDRLPGVKGYIVYRYNPESGGYAELGRQDGAGSVRFTDYGAPEGVKYLVCGYVEQSGVEYRGAFSEPAAAN